MEISVEQIYEFKACPLRFKFTEIDKLKGIHTHEERGIKQVLLATISYFYMNLHEGKLLSIDNLKDKFTSLWYDEDKVFNIQYDDKKNQRKKELEAFSVLAAFHRQQKFNPDRPVAVNMDFRLKMAEDLFVVGRIPLIRETPRGHEIVNFKTGYRKPSEFYQRTDMDLTLQALGYHSIFRKEVESMALHHLKSGGPIFVERKREDYKRLNKSVLMIKKAMDEGWFYPNEGFQCDTCPAQTYCMEWR